MEKLAGWARSVVTPGVLLRLAAVGAALAYVLAQSGYGLFLLLASACFAIGCMSIVLVTGWAGQVSLAQAALMGVGAFLMGAFTGTNVVSGAGRLPFFVGLALIPVVVAPIAVLIGLPALRVRGLHFALVTLAAAYAADAVLFTSTGLTGHAENLNVQRPRLAGIALTSDRGYLLLVLAVMTIAGFLLRNVGRSRLGRAFYAVRDSEVAASVMGLNVARVKVIAFAIAGVYAALAGALYAGVVGNVYSVFRTFDVGKSLFILATVVLAGYRSVSGAVIAGLLYIYLPEYVGKVVNPVMTQFVAGVGVALTVVFMPEGMIGIPRRLQALFGPLLTRRPLEPGPSSPAHPVTVDASPGPRQEQKV
jgi:branched-chain amino acid transport system permease protein